jgi:hypothetical protein
VPCANMIKSDPIESSRSSYSAIGNTIKDGSSGSFFSDCGICRALVRLKSNILSKCKVRASQKYVSGLFGLVLHNFTYVRYSSSII